MPEVGKPSSEPVQAQPQPRAGQVAYDRSYEGFKRYVEEKKKGAFAIINELAAGISGVGLKEPTLTFSDAPSQGNRDAVAVYNKDENTITCYNSMYAEHLIMLDRRAKGIPDALRTDSTIAHELGHALLHAAVLGNPNVADARYLGSTMYRKLDESACDLIGAYVSRRMNGLPTDNASLSRSMLKMISRDDSHGADAEASRLKDFDRMIGSDRYAPASLRSITIELERIRDHIGRQLTFYDYPLLGFARLLNEESAATIPEILKAAFRYPESTTGVMDYVTERAGRTLQSARDDAVDKALGLVLNEFDKSGAAGLDISSQRRVLGLVGYGVPATQRGAEADSKVLAIADFLLAKAEVIEFISELRANSDEADRLLGQAEKQG